MKTKTFLAAIMLLLCATQMWAYDFEVDGLYYNLLTDKTNEVEVTYKSKTKGYVIDKYNEDWNIHTATIPASVQYSGKTYSVTSIGKYAFAYCIYLSSVTIPESVTSIGLGGFDLCTSLSKVQWNAKNCIIEYYIESYVDGVYYPPSPFRNSSGISIFSFGDKVESIPTFLCAGLSGLSSIIIPESVTSIGNEAFYDCSGLSSVIIGNNVTSIGDGAFYNCSNLISVTIPESVTSIGYNAFNNCSGLTLITIGNRMENIGDNAFSGCNVKEIHFVGNIYDWCNKLWDPTIIANGYSLFINEDKVEDLVVPNNVKFICAFAFSGCGSLTSVTFENGVKSIGTRAFSGCRGLTSVTIPKGVGIDESSFDGCSGLTSVNINTDYISRYNSSYSYLKSIFGSQVTEYIIGDDITYIGARAFYDCSSLTSVTISKNVTGIAEYAFFGCSGLTSVTIPNSVTTIGENAFRACSSLTSVTIGNSVTLISNWAFWGCSSLTSVIIPNSVTTIGENAFLACSRLTSVTIGSSVTNIGKYAFSGCYNVESWTLEAIKPPILGEYAIGGGGTFYIPVDGFDAYKSNTQWKYFNLICSSVTRTCGADGDNGDNIIGEYSCDSVLIISGIGKMKDFDDLSQDPLNLGKANIQTLIILDGITSIGNNAFRGCSGLISVTIPNSVTSIGIDAFDGCSHLTSVHINDIAAWCKINFGNSSANPLSYSNVLYLDEQKQSTLVIPESVSSIGNFAFVGCNKVKTLVLGKSIKTIGALAFADCKSIMDIYCFAERMPEVNDKIRGDSFKNVSRKAYLWVPANLVNDYMTDDYWGHFEVKAMEAESANTTEVVVKPETSTAEIIWPSSSSAETYELTIKGTWGNELFTLVFNSSGQLQSIAFKAPSADGNHAPEQTEATGFRFTVSGLEENTFYNYTIVVKDAADKTIATYTGSFRTKGGETAVENVEINGGFINGENGVRKVLRDGQVIILMPDGTTYDAAGREMR